MLGDHEHRTRALLRNAAGNHGVTMIWNIKQLPCFTVWKNTVAEEDGYVTGLEPGTNFPNSRSFESGHGRTVMLSPHASATFELQLEGHVNSEQVGLAADQIAQLRQGKDPEVLPRPLPEWCESPAEVD